MSSIYLDNNATAPLDPLALEAMRQCYQQCQANPASQHQAGQQARRQLEAARDSIALTLGANLQHHTADSLIFTSGATEANNLAVLGLVGSQPGKIVVSAIEHPSLFGPVQHLEQKGWEIHRIPVDLRGVIDLDCAAELITPDTQLVSIMLGNHETGVLQPVQEISSLCCSAGVRLHTDATQVVGKLPVHFRDLQLHALSFSAHKFHGPIGIGGLLLKHGVTIQPLHHGGLQQFGYRPGTESVALIIGMQTALETWSEQPVEHAKEIAQMRDSFENLLEQKLPWITLIGRESLRTPNTSSVAFTGLDRQSLMMALDQGGLACSTGSACASGSSDPSPVLQAMGLDDTLIEGALRFSFSRYNNPTEIQQAVDLVGSMANRLRSTNPSGKMISESPQQAAKRL